MKDKEIILKELEKNYLEASKKFGIKTSLDDLDSCFFVRDYILSSGFVSDSVLRQISTRIVEALHSWNGFFHSLIIPNPNDFVNVNESKMFSEEEKKKALKLMSKIMYFMRRNNHANLINDNNLRAKFIDDSFNFWKKSLLPYLVDISKKLSDEWEKKSS